MGTRTSARIRLIKTDTSKNSVPIQSLIPEEVPLGQPDISVPEFFTLDNLHQYVSSFEQITDIPYSNSFVSPKANFKSPSLKWMQVRAAIKSFVLKNGKEGIVELPNGNFVKVHRFVTNSRDKRYRITLTTRADNLDGYQNPIWRVCCYVYARDENQKSGWRDMCQAIIQGDGSSRAETMSKIFFGFEKPEKEIDGQVLQADGYNIMRALLYSLLIKEDQI